MNQDNNDQFYENIFNDDIPNNVQKNDSINTYSTQSNSEIANNETFDHDSTINPQSINSQSQVLQEPTSQSINSIENGSSQTFTGKKMKKNNLGIIIGIVIVVTIVIVGVIFGSRLLLNTDNKFNSKNTNESNTFISKNSSNKNTITVGGIKMPIVKEGMGIYKVRNEYVFRGGDVIDSTSNEWFKNIVKFGDYLWRIVKINEDGTIKLVFLGQYDEDPIPRIINSLYKTEYIDDDEDFNENTTYENSKIRSFLNDEFINTGAVGYYDYKIYKIIPDNYENYMVKKSFDIAKVDYYFRADFVLPDIQYSEFEDYVGLISLREFAEASSDIDEKSPYLKCKTSYSSGIGCYKDNFLAERNSTTTLLFGGEGVYFLDHQYSEIRSEVLHTYNEYSNFFLPVINLKSTVKFTKGDGTPKNPYIVE